jgi:hypothetical protein
LKEEIDMARIKGKSIVFSVEGTDYAGQVSNVTFSSAVGTLGFGNYEDSLEFTCTVTGFQDTAANSLHTYLWNNPGAELDIIFSPHGNSSPSAAQPLYTAKGYAETVPDLGGAAGEFFVYDLTIILDAKPFRKIS